MRHLLKSGWKNMVLNKRTVLMISLYQLVWSFIIFYAIRHAISPFLRAMPDYTVSSNVTELYWLELRFLAAKTDFLSPYLFSALLLLLLHMIITPLLQAGLFGALAHSYRIQERNRFFSQLKQNWKTFSLVYWIKTVLIVVPSVIVGLPILKALIASYFSVEAISPHWLPLLLLIMWTICISSISHGLLLGFTSRQSWQIILSTLIKRALTLLAIFLIIIAISCSAQLIYQITAVYLSTFILPILMFTMPIIQTLLKAWTISSQAIVFTK